MPELFKTTSLLPPPYPLTPSQNCSRSQSSPRSCCRCRRRGDIRPHVVAFFVVVLFIDHAPAPDLAFNARSKRKISSDATATAVAAEAEARQASGQRLGMTEPFPSSLYPLPILCTPLNRTHNRSTPRKGRRGQPKNQGGGGITDNPRGGGG